MALKSNNSLIIAIPVHNEELIIGKTIQLVNIEINKIKLNIEVLIINDGSSDKTKELLTSYSKKNKKLRFINHKKNNGYGKAIQSGIKYSIENNFNYILFMDSDLTNNPKDIRKFVNEIDNNFDCVKASRYIKGGKVYNVPASRYYTSRIGNIIASSIFNVGVKDCTNGFLMLKVSNFKSIQLKENGFQIIMEEIYYLKKISANFKEIPITLIHRKSGKSSFRYSPNVFYSYLKYPIKSLWQ